MQEETNQGKILGSLLESSKTTAELANELGYVNPKGTPRYNIITNDLSKLIKRGYIESKKEKLENKPGNIPTLYSIINSSENINKILEEYPYLIEKMQRSELALETIVNENSSWIFNFTEKEHKEPIENQIVLIQMGKENWKKQLKLSQEFFRFCLNNKYSDMKERVRKLSKISSKHWYTSLCEFKYTPTNSEFLREANCIFYIIFEACVTSDILRGQSNREAIYYLKQRTNEVSEKQIEQLSDYYKNIKVAPEFLRGKKLVPIENPKLQEIEQEFTNNGGQFIQYSI